MLTPRSNISAFAVALVLGFSGAAPAQDTPAGDEEKVEGEYEDVEGEYEDVEGGFEDVEGGFEEVEGGFEDAPADGGQGDTPPADGTPADAPSDTPPTDTPPSANGAPVDAPPSDTPPSDPASAAEPAPVPPPSPEAVPAPADPATTDGVDVDTPSEEPPRRRVGEPIPLTRREPLVNQFQFEANIHYGLVGTGPTRLTNDVRFGIFDWWELRTAFLPHPSSLMSRFKIGSQQGPFGALILDGGLAHFDAGIRLVPEEGEAEAGFRFHLEAGVAYTRAIGDRFSLWTSARTRYRYSLLSDDGQTAVAADMQLTYDLLDNLAVSGGLAYAEVVGTKVRELAVDFAEPGRPGLSHFLLRNDGWSRSVTIPLAITYARIETFDVDVFVTPRVWPQFDLAFGAGLRWRFDVIKDTKSVINDASEYFTKKSDDAKDADAKDAEAKDAEAKADDAPTD